MNAELDLVENAVVAAQTAAAAAGRDCLNRFGDRDACGFAWVEIYGVRSNSKLGRALQKCGAYRSRGGSLQFWNPVGYMSQSMNVLEAGAEAFARVIKDKLALERVYTGSRMD